MNANVKQDTMIYLDQIHFKAEFVQVKDKLLNSDETRSKEKILRD